MDVVSQIMGKIGVRYKKDYSGYVKPRGKSIAQRLTEAQDELLQMCQDKKGLADYEKFIPTLVLGAVMIQNGSAINENVMTAIVAAIDNDEWGNRQLERKLYLNDFKEILASYDHKTPTNEWVDHHAKFGIDDKDSLRGRFSLKTVMMALHYVKQFYSGRSWYGGTTIIYGSDGYALLMGVEFNEERTPELAVQGIQSLFEVPLFFTDKCELNIEEIDTEPKKQENV